MKRQLLKALGLVFIFFVFSYGPGLAAEDRFQPDLIKLKEDVYVFVRSPSNQYPVLSNVVVIINEDDVVVVDGGSPRHVENVIRGIKGLTGKPISTVITTHWHQDHYWGNAVYRKHYPDVKFITHENTAVTLMNRAGDLDNVLNQLDDPEGLEEINQRIDKAIEGFRENGQEFMIDYFEDYKTGFPEVGENLREVENVPFDATFSDKLVLKRKNRTIEVLYLGRANTNGDAFIYLPDDKILVTGDTVVWPTPFGFFSYPAEWGETLRKALALDFEILVPGHGDVQYDTTYVETLIRLMESVTGQTRAAVANGADSVEAAREAVNFSEFDPLIAGDDPLLLNRFQAWFKTPIMDSAFKEAVGEEIRQFDPYRDPYDSTREEEE